MNSYLDRSRSLFITLFTTEKYTIYSILFVASIAIIAIGASLLFEGGATASQLRLLMLAKTKTGIDAGELGGGISAEFLGGAAGLTLGILRS